MMAAETPKNKEMGDVPAGQSDRGDRVRAWDWARDRPALSKGYRRCLPTGSERGRRA
jgi:hypothetical protein